MTTADRLPSLHPRHEHSSSVKVTSDIRTLSIVTLQLARRCFPQCPSALWNSEGSDRRRPAGVPAAKHDSFDAAASVFPDSWTRSDFPGTNGTTVPVGSSKQSSLCIELSSLRNTFTPSFFNPRVEYNIVSRPRPSTTKVRVLGRMAFSRCSGHVEGGVSDFSRR